MHEDHPDYRRHFVGTREAGNRHSRETALVRAGLEALIAREASKRLAELGGTQPKISNIPRRRIG